MYSIEGIDFSYEHKAQCPKCASEGGDRSGDNLHIYGLDDDGRSLGAYCFDEDTDVFTYNGIKKIKDLIGKQTRIVNGNAEWEEVVFRSYGFDEIYELEISSNMVKKTIKTTANHLWFVKNNEKCLRTDELKPRQYLIGGELPKKSFKLIKDAVAHGFVFGDGSLHWRGNSSAVPFYSKTKYAVYEYLKDADCVITVGVRKRDTEVMPNLTFRHDKYSFKSLPLLAESDDYLFSWLSGYFAADGCLHGTGSSILNSANKEHLEFVEKVCARLGIRTRKIKSQTRAEGKTVLRKGESTIYNIRFYTKDLPENFFIREVHKKPNVKYDRKAWKVLSVKKTGIIKEVYCCETSTQSFLLADYILTHNCFRCNFTVPSEEFLAEVGKDSFSGNFDKKGDSMISKRDEEKLKEKSLTPKQLAEIYEKTSDTLNTKYRGLDGNVAKELGVRWEYNADGSLKAMYFPTYVKDNGEMKVTGYKVRDLPKNFHSFGYVGKCNLMGGMTDTIADTVIICGGENDMLTIKQELGKTITRSFNVVTSLLGESSTADMIRQYISYFEKHKKIILALDNDASGKEAQQACIDLLPKDKVYLANLRYKDANDYLKNREDAKTFAQDYYWNVSPVEDFGIIGSGSLFDYGLEAANDEGIDIPFHMADLKPYIPKFLFDSIVLIVGSTSIGKTANLDTTMTSIIMSTHEKVGVLSLEASRKKFAQKMASRIIGVPLNRLPKEEQIELQNKHRDKIDNFYYDENGEHRFFFADSDFDSIEEAEKCILRLIKIYGCRILIGDPIQNIIGNKSNEEQRSFMLFCEKIKKKYGALILFGTHTRKSTSGSKGGSDGAVQKEDDIEGSGSIAKSASLIITLSRNKNAEDLIEKNTTYYSIPKNRDFEMTGELVAKSFYRNSCSRLYPYSYAEKHNFFQNDKVGEVIEDDLGFYITAQEFEDIQDNSEVLEEYQSFASVDVEKLNEQADSEIQLPDW